MRLGELAAAVFGLALTAAPASLSTPLNPQGRLTHWDARTGFDRQSFSGNSFTLTVSRQPTSTSTARVVLDIVAHGRPLLRLTGADSFDPAPADFTVARLDAADNREGVLLVTQSIGAHCCAEVVTAEPVGGVWRPIRVGSFDGGPPEAVRDVDGDGVADIVMIDDAFDYAFASFAGSYRPPAIFNLRDGVVWNVSAEPKYGPLYQADEAKTEKACLGPRQTQTEVNGACAAFAADAARLGQLSRAWPSVMAHYDRTAQDWPQGCGVVRAAGVCPKAYSVQYPDFPTALWAFLTRTGYIRSPGQPLDTPVKPSVGRP